MVEDFFLALRDDRNVSCFRYAFAQANKSNRD